MISRRLGKWLLALCSSLGVTFVCIRRSQSNKIGSVLSNLAFSFSSGGRVSLKSFHEDYEVLFATDGVVQEVVVDSIEDLMPHHDSDVTISNNNKEKMKLLSLDHLPPARKVCISNLTSAERSIFCLYFELFDVSLVSGPRNQSDIVPHFRISTHSLTTLLHSSHLHD
mmetsp:Transcript_10731/g.16122  ORF Transcript_10731/g.16122 Transcript_10731/m.16122 type:complete len:168 (-) Transcript_10731:1323-1826(-)